MSLTPTERDHLLLFTQALLAAQRRERGLLLNVPEATALIAHAICEWARDGMDLPTARDRARGLLGPQDVLPEVLEIVTDVKVEARFDDGSRLVVVEDPFGVGTIPGTDLTAPTPEAHLEITNTAGIAIGLTSHLHLAEANPRLRMDRAAAFGMRLAVPTGDTLWVEPGTTVTCGIVAIRGARVVIGSTGVVDGPLDDPEVRDRALHRLRSCGYLDDVAGTWVNTTTEADDAVRRLMIDRSGS